MYMCTYVGRSVHSFYYACLTLTSIMHTSRDNMHSLVNMYVPWSAIRRSSNRTIWPFDPREPPQSCLGECPQHKSPLLPCVMPLLFCWNFNFLLCAFV